MVTSRTTLPLPPDDLFNEHNITICTPSLSSSFIYPSSSPILPRTLPLRKKNILRCHILPPRISLIDPGATLQHLSQLRNSSATNSNPACLDPLRETVPLSPRCPLLSPLSDPNPNPNHIKRLPHNHHQATTPSPDKHPSCSFFNLFFHSSFTLPFPSPSLLPRDQCQKSKG